MTHETYDRIQKDANNGSYEIIELNESEPIVFKQTRKKQQELHNQNNRRIILVIPNSYKHSHSRPK
jgi:hypothetical protein